MITGIKVAGMMITLVMLWSVEISHEHELEVVDHVIDHSKTASKESPERRD